MTTKAKPAKLTEVWNKTHERVVAANPPAARPDDNATPDPNANAAATKVLNVRIPKDVHKALRQIAIDRDASLRETVIHALKRYASDPTPTT